ncbi:MAG: Gfo/Idh/MocA family oxidoreductase, partial [Cyclobacteriaceae bacterium]|nr:Gfo/Idh/MocA family oxidoreductase [Cyclobacteriaceae bacterium]
MKPTRRKFIKNVTAGGILGITAPTIISSAKGKKLLIERNINPYEDVRYSPNDTIRLAVVGTGIIGHHNVEAALKIKGVELVAACDLYDGRLVRMKEKYGNQIVTTRNYKEIIERKDIDAVLVATSDNWHDQITIDAMKAGKAVYCEKPMVHLMEQGMKVVEAAKKTKSVIEVGSNGMSGVVIKKARELYKSGVLGELIAAENVSDRHSAMGAWQYSIPPNVTKNDLDWDSFQRNTPKVAFDPTRFFRWRNYQAYGTGIAGDMFVHMFSGLNYILDSKGPERIYSSGGLQYWKDG